MRYWNVRSCQMRTMTELPHWGVAMHVCCGAEWLLAQQGKGTHSSATIVCSDRLVKVAKSLHVCSVTKATPNTNIHLCGWHKGSAYSVFWNHLWGFFVDLDISFVVWLIPGTGKVGGCAGEWGAGGRERREGVEGIFARGAASPLLCLRCYPVSFPPVICYL